MQPVHVLAIITAKPGQRADILAAAPGGYCAPMMEPPASTDPPSDVSWPPADTLMPLQDLSEEYCAELEEGGTALPNAGEDPVNPDDPALTNSCADAGCAAATGGGSWLALLLLGGLRRRRS